MKTALKFCRLAIVVALSIFSISKSFGIGLQEASVTIQGVTWSDGGCPETRVTPTNILYATFCDTVVIGVNETAAKIHCGPDYSEPVYGGQPQVNLGGTGGTVTYDHTPDTGGWTVTITGFTQPGVVSVTAKVTGDCGSCDPPTVGPTPNYTATGIIHVRNTGCQSGTCSKPLNPLTLPAGQIKNSNLPQSTLDFKMNLGLATPLTDSGFLWLKAATPSTSLAQPSALQLAYDDLPTVQTFPTNGFMQQLLVPQGLVNINVINSYEYHLECYALSNVTTMQTNGLYGLTNTPYCTWIVANTNGAASSNQLSITESIAGYTNHIYQFTYTTNATNTGWSLLQPDGITTVSTWQSVDPTNSAKTNYYRQVSASGTIYEQTRLTYQYLSAISNAVLVQGMSGTGTVTWTTNYTYYSSDATNGAATNQLQRVDYPDGNWVYFKYDSDGRTNVMYSAYGTNLPPTAGVVPNPTNDHCMETDYYYSLTNAADGIDDPGDSNNPRLPLKTVLLLPVPGSPNWSLHEVSRTYHRSDLANGWDEFQQCPMPGAMWDDDANLITINQKYVNLGSTDFRNGMVESVSNPDGTATVYNYVLTTSNLTTTAQTGVPDDWAIPSTIVNGTQTVTVSDGLGRTIFTTNTDILTSTVLSRNSYFYASADPYGRNYVLTDLAGHSTSYNFECCGLDSVTDPDGVVTSYTYDPLKRPIATAVLRGPNAITTTNILDASGRVLVTQRIGSDGSVITQSQYQYDVLSRVIAQTNALNGVTTTTNVVINSQLSVTNVYPDGGTQIQIFGVDGSLWSVSGTATRPMLYLPGVEQDGTGGPWRRYTLNIKPTSSGGTNEWTKTYLDGVGNNYKTVYAAASGSPALISYFNGYGQLTNQTDPDGIITLYAYNAKGERAYSVVDSNQNLTIDWSGADRITFTTNDVASEHAKNVLRTRTFVWSTGSNASNEISRTEVSTDGTQSFNAIYNNGIATWRTNITVYGSSGFRYVTNRMADGSFTINTYQYGQLLSVLQKDASGTQIGLTTNGYDAHGRRSVKWDAKNGTTTYTLNSNDQVASIVTPSPTETTTYYFDALGRTAGTLLPDGTTVTNTYYTTGDLMQTYGSRTYPVGYGYDAQGRMTKMTNWSSFITSTGARVTTWAYDQYRGFLSGKSYDGATQGPTYTYTAGGKLATRLWARGTNTTYAYNKAGDLGTVIYNDGVTPGVTNGYDRIGRLSTVNHNTTVTVYTYNDQNQILTEGYTGGPLDGVSVINGYDILLRRTNNVTLRSGTVLNMVTNNYDAISRLLTISDRTNSASYTYLANSPKVSQISFAQSGTTRMTTTMVYDNLNRLTVISNANASGVPLDLHGYAYNSANQRTTATNVDGTYWVYQYDALGQVTSGIKYWADGSVVAGQQFGYGFDDIGNRTGTSAGGDEWGDNQRYASYSANSLNQYTSRTVPSAVDVIGTATNTATVTVNNISTSRKSNYYRAQLPLSNGSAPVWQSVTNLAVLPVSTNFVVQTNINGNMYLPQTPESFTYDADGNLKQDGRWIYMWDAENRLISMTNISTVPAAARMRLDFAYDFKGRRVNKNVVVTGVTNTTKFAYDGWNLAVSLNSSFGLINAFMWGSDLSGSLPGAGGVGGLLKITYIDSATTNSFVAYDGNGNVEALINAADGTVNAQYENGPFGEVIRATGPMAKSNALRFSTKYQDDETGLLYFGNRYYNVSEGRWLNRDSIEERGGQNIYVFVDNTPASSYDEDGRLTISFIPPSGPVGSQCGSWFHQWLYDYGITLQPQYLVTKVTIARAVRYPCDDPHNFADVAVIYEALYVSVGHTTSTDTDEMGSVPNSRGIANRVDGESRMYLATMVGSEIATWGQQNPGSGVEMSSTKNEPSFWDRKPSVSNATRSSWITTWNCCCTPSIEGTPQHSP